MAINSDKVSTTNIAKSHSSGEFRWRDFTFFENCKDFCHALFSLCPHSLVCCNPIPKKGFFSLGICVPWCPRVSHGCSKPIKCCSRVPFPFDGQPAFSLGTPSPYKKRNSATVQTVVILDTPAFYNTTLSPSLSCFLVMNCVI